MKGKYWNNYLSVLMTILKNRQAYVLIYYVENFLTAELIII